MMCTPLQRADDVLLWFKPIAIRAERVNGHVEVYYPADDDQALGWLIATKEYAWQNGLHELNIKFVAESAAT